jgi:triacylglycerol lipase
MDSVVLVHGIFDSGNVFKKMAGLLENSNFRTYAPDLRPSSGRTGLDESARQLKSYVDVTISTDETFYLIGFSMGGLVCRYYLQRLDGMKRVHRFIALSTPHYGSWSAYLLPNKGGRQMRPGSEFLKDLNSDVDKLAQVDVVSIWTPFDLSIIPATSSRLAIGKELRIYIVLHPIMVRDRRTLEAVMYFLKK